MTGRLTLFFFFLLSLLSFRICAEDFVVTSNADSGPGTLREALTLAAANGTAEKDFIKFNLPDVSETGRTIVILTDLPKLSSNLVIDGSTQPGNKIGISNAKITIKTFRSTNALTVFAGDNIDQIEFYGLFLWDTSNPCISDPDGAEKTAINIKNSQNIVFGSQNKGNVINGYKYNAILLTSDQDIYIANNIFGLNPVSSTLDPVCSGFITLDDVINVTIGDENAGNTSFSGLYITLSSASTASIVNIKYNNFAVGVDGVSTWHSGSGTYLSIFADSFKPQPQNVDITVSDNLISHYGEGLGGMAFASFGGNLTINHNWFGTDRSATLPLNLKKAHPGEGTGIRLDQVAATVTIGDVNPASGNIFAYSDVGVVANNTPNIKLIRNSFKCINYKEYINNLTLPQISITANTGEYISGTTSANALVDVFTSDDCVNCSPQTYIGSTTADAAGNWKYTFSTAPTGSILANAHAGNISSNFTKPEINISKLQVTNADCGQSGMITGVTVKNTDTFKWVDDKGKVMSTELQLVNAPPGRYKLIAGKYCTVESDYITIEDLKPQIIDAFMTTYNTSCDKQDGAIKGLYAYTTDHKTLTYNWYDKDNKLVSHTLDIENLAAGEYTFYAITADGCESKYGPVIINNNTGPSLDQSNQIITSSKCYESKGAITGIIVSGTNVKYSWQNQQQQEVATTADLTDQPPGIYTLKVIDDSQCSPVFSTAIEIPAVNDVAINTDNMIVQDATCYNFDGSIKNIQVNGSNLTYSWTNEQNIQVGTNVDLTGAPPGKYILTVSGGLCVPISTTTITINSVNGVLSLDNSTINVQSATCGGDNGSITGLKATGATSFAWRRDDGSNTIISTSLDLKEVSAGNYQLTISSASCSRTYTFTIELLPPISFPVFAYTKTPSCAAFGTGTITLNTDNAPSQPAAYRWVNTSGITVGFDKTVQFLPAGTYKLFLTDQYGCENFYQDYTIEAYPEFKVVQPGIAANIECGIGTGSVSATTVTGGSLTYTYQWLDEAGNTIGSQPYIDNLSPGKYLLRITDGGCDLAELKYIIEDIHLVPPTPSVNDIDLCNKGEAMIKVNDPYPTALYRLYDTETSTQPIAEVRGGTFNINVTDSRRYYVTLTYGSCESARTEVKVSVGAFVNNITNTFTPNGDGVNDYWMIKGFENYSTGTVSIYNHNGQLVFQSKGYATPFDGTLYGKPLPAGVYYYIINIKKCSIISGHLTLLR
ncbi:gliding motility-associated C-terminal domain-containing protein [Mucilaginibacter segetis]|uniref:Gliding motility-associated C-terminal domain-containing protein n=1 Tax=Mucilaginibacter segetis TaxID=2793071 RepID=A0A934PNL7_9SPHI|nr:gliding motility-associated C-terminal domain-containing protein [Mucilaginibacter segetis]MBK0377869.1 gliding motility-associated C-terminal domain-containing protein [Mucilaginibacter segetis]